MKAKQIIKGAWFAQTVRIDSSGEIDVPEVLPVIWIQPDIISDEELQILYRDSQKAGHKIIFAESCFGVGDESQSEAN